MKDKMKWLALTGLVVVSGCRFDSSTVNVPGASWDLSALEAMTAGFWKVSHKTKGGEAKPYEYYFGICEDTDFGNGESYPDPKCHIAEEAVRRSSLDFKETAPAWQLNRAENGEVSECYRLGHSTIADGVDFDFMLLDPADTDRGYDADPSKGFVLKYSSGGDNSADGVEGGCEASGSSRDLFIEFQCDEEASFSKPDDNMVFEEPQCTYRILFRSVFGCPAECARVNEQACAGNGVCGYNRHTQMAQCFCDTGYGGDACNEDLGAGAKNATARISQLEQALANGETTDSTLVALLIICFILLIVVVSVLGYMCYKTRQVLQNDKYVGLLGPVDTMQPHASSINDGGEKL